MPYLLATVALADLRPLLCKPRLCGSCLATGRCVDRFGSHFDLDFVEHARSVFVPSLSLGFSPWVPPVLQRNQRDVAWLSGLGLATHDESSDF